MNEKPSSVFDRIERDVERGDLGSARCRLQSYLTTCGYDPAVLRRLGELSLEMKDRFEAGRYWILADATGAEAEEIIQSFVLRAGAEPYVIAGFLPRAWCCEFPEEYPPQVRMRLERWGLQEPLISKATRGTPRKPRSEGGFIARVAITAIVLGILLCFVIGAETIAVAVIKWIVG